jgi:hypothetical protein
MKTDFIKIFRLPIPSGKGSVTNLFSGFSLCNFSIQIGNLIF